MLIDDMTIEQLLELNEIICERIDYLRAKQDQNVLAQMHIGNQVSFN
ncbi:transposase, partial [Ketobacter sp. MCCC 1A13808]|nr:transposase [Ketobacter sp. MCCC 1A13808]